jgi:hypothetical protein
MADERLALLRGRITKVATYGSPQSGGSPPRLPSLDPKAHRARLLLQLDDIRRQIDARGAARDELATREIIAVHPAPDARLAADKLASKRADARLVGEDPDTGIVLLDVADAGLGHLRKKIDEFADDTRTKVKIEKDGSRTEQRANAAAIAPIDIIALAALLEVGPRLEAITLEGDRAYWFEVACRGGYRRPAEETTRSRAQVLGQLHRMGAMQPLDEFPGPEQVYFFLRLTRQQLERLRTTVDCIYEVDLAPPPVRDLNLHRDVRTPEVRHFSLEPPALDAPAVVILDTGISTGHPLLRGAILSATKAGDEIPSVEDTDGHGTKMAGIALHWDLGAAIERGHATAHHWLSSSRVLVRPNTATASDELHEKWPDLTRKAVLAAEADDAHPRNRVFTLAVTRTMQEPPFVDFGSTLWSHAVDQLAFGDGEGRLMVVSAGNAREEQWPILAEQYPQLQLSEKIHQPAQAANALTVGAFTERVTLPGIKDFAETKVVATRPGSISPFTSTGEVGWPIKPDVVLEGGNLAFSGTLPNPDVLGALTTSRRHVIMQPLDFLSMTSEATARAAHLAARIWAVEPKLTPSTVRGLIVHSAQWTSTMMEQFPLPNERLRACGYGVPNEIVASQCARGLVTVIVEDEMPNAVIEERPKKEPPKRATSKTTEPVLVRKVMLYRVPIPESLLDPSDPNVELRVTLSYFTEPNKYGRRTFPGLELKWDMQGPQEREDQFIQRVNMLERPEGPDGKRQKPAGTSSFDWEIGIKARSEGTVQSDRWRGRMSQLVGDKLIAVVPVLGWWTRRKELREQSMRFSLIVSIFGPNVYEVIAPRIQAASAVDVTTSIEV